MSKTSTPKPQATTTEPSVVASTPPAAPAKKPFRPTTRLPPPLASFDFGWDFVWREGVGFDGTYTTVPGEPVTEKEKATLGPIKVRRLWYMGVLQLAGVSADDND